MAFATADQWMVNGVSLVTVPGARISGLSGVAHAGAFLRTENDDVAEVTAGQLAKTASTNQSTSPDGILVANLFAVVVPTTLGS